MANKEHISKQFDADLEEVRTRVLQMGGFVEEQIEYAIEALTSGNEDLIDQVITRDHRVNAMEVSIDEICNQIIARRQPTASDLLYISQTRDVVLGGSALFVMALGMSVPLLLLGASAGALLPKAGAWMESIKRFFGVLLLAVAIWIISPVINEVVYMLLWAALLIISAIYLQAIDPLPQRASGLQKFLKGVGVIALLMGVALLIGVLSGSRDVLQPLSKLNLADTASSGSAEAVPASYATLPFQRVKTIADLDEQIQSSRDKYVMVRFHADWCISCKEMDRFTFSDAKVQARLKEVVLLEVDVTEGTPDDTALLKRFKLFGPPGILFIDRQGHDIPDIKIIGFLNNNDFLAVLNAVLI
jgi:thiol:disulfide interchange protein DsbD